MEAEDEDLNDSMAAGAGEAAVYQVATLASATSSGGVGVAATEAIYRPIYEVDGNNGVANPLHDGFAGPAALRAALAGAGGGSDGSEDEDGEILKNEVEYFLAAGGDVGDADDGHEYYLAKGVQNMCSCFVFFVFCFCFLSFGNFMLKH